MFSWLEKSVSSVLGPLKRCVSMDDGQGLEILEDDACIWSRDLENHYYGEFSIATACVASGREGQSEVRTGQHATFAGVYDGHDGWEASRYVRRRLSMQLLELAKESGAMSENVIRSAFSQTERRFVEFITEEIHNKRLRRFPCTWVQRLTRVGSCCLVGVICEGTLYVANLGDSRAVLGYLGRSNKIVAEQLTQDHNASAEAVRNELKELHPYVYDIVVENQGTWSVKGIRKVSRSIGDVFTKRTEFALDAMPGNHYLPEAYRVHPILSPVPTITTRALRPKDKFLIFASSGLWEHLTNKEAVKIVHRNPRLGIAKRLLMSAVQKALKKTNKTYDDIKRVLPWKRAEFHDDITIVVIFIDPDNPSPPEVSVTAGYGNVGPADFDF